MTVPLYNLTDTWNDGGTVFNAIKMDVTDTAYAAGSKVLDLQMGSTNVFRAMRDSGGASSFLLGAGTAGLNVACLAYQVVFSVATTIDTLNLAPDVVTIVSSSPELRFGTRTSLFSVTDEILEQRNSTAAQTFRIYNTYTDASNYERMSLSWSSNVMTIAMEKAGTGNNRAIQIKSGGGTNIFDFAVTRSAGDCWATPLSLLVNSPGTSGFFAFDGTSGFGGLANTTTDTFALGVSATPTTASMAIALTWTTAKNVVINTAAIATNASDGFLYIPTCAGTPTGTPTGFTGRVPMVFDTTNSQFWFYVGGAWKQPKTPAGAATVTWQ